MIENPPLLTIHRGFRRAGKVLLDAFRGAQTSHLCDAMEGRGAVDWRIKPMDPTKKALTPLDKSQAGSTADYFLGDVAETKPGTTAAVAFAGATPGPAPTSGHFLDLPKE